MISGRCSGVTIMWLSLACSGPSPVPGPAPTPKASLARPARPPVPPLTPGPVTPVDVEAARRAHAHAQTVLAGGPLAPDDRPQFTPIENPSGTALQRFHQALRRLERHEGAGKVRITWYGSSSVAADQYTAYLRGYLQHRFGDGGVGYVALVPRWPWHRHHEVSVHARGPWIIEHAQKTAGRQDGFFGLLGASAAASSRRARSEISARPHAFSGPSPRDHIEILYLTQPSGGQLVLKAGHAHAQSISTTAPAPPTVGRYRMTGEPPYLPLRIQPKGDGEVRLFGAVFEHDGPGVVLDTLGVGGTRAANHLMWNEALWREQIRDRAPQLYVLAYGTNESVDHDEPIELYRDALRSVLDRFARTLPDASCLLVGPVDFPIRDTTSGAWIERARIAQIIAVQRQVAEEHDCGFWDTRAFMGGVAAMTPWVDTPPPLAKADHLHFTTLGYLYQGRVLADALMAGYDAR